MPIDLAEWLKAYDLHQCQAVLEENGIDLDVVKDLLDEDLTVLGLNLGDRKRFRRAVEALDNPPAATSASQPTIDAERRNLTIFFSDLVGSTALSAALDPEELHDLILTYQKTVSQEIEQMGGHVAKYLGDGVLAYFGFPMAQEDAAERAVRTGLAVVKAVADINVTSTAEALAARVGIASGLVVIGDLVGAGESQERSVAGQSLNLAARLEGLAQSGQVVVSRQTRQLIKDAFEVKDLGSHELKGIAEPVNAYAVIAEQVNRSRFDAHSFGRLRPMVGRAAEMTRLKAMWQSACRGRGQCALLIGEAGIGKSRITHALLDAANATAHDRIFLHCAPHNRDSAFWPAIQQLAAQLGSTNVTDPDSRLAALKNYLHTRGIQDDEATAIIATLLGLPIEGHYPPLTLAPAILRQRTMALMAEQLVHVDGARPKLIIVEDIHWIDVSSRELLLQIIEAIEDRGIMLLMTARPELQNGFKHASVHAFELGNLSLEDTRAIATDIADGKTLPEQIVTSIFDRADGVPLFVEELTKTLLESGLLVETETLLQIDRPLPPTLLPDTLFGSLMTRLDRLQSARKVAQYAACIGRYFQLPVLAEILQESLQDTESAVAQLVNAELVYRHRPSSSTTDDVVYAFKHALVRDAAYESMLKVSRREAHGRILRVLENRQTDQPEILARHAELADQNAVAIQYWMLAAKSAIARPAYVEAMGHINNATSLLPDQSEDPDILALELPLRIMEGQVLSIVRGFGNPDTIAAIGRAKQIVDLIGDTHYKYPVYFGNWQITYVSGDVNLSLQFSSEMIDAALSDNDLAAQVCGYSSASISHLAHGDMVNTKARHDQVDLSGNLDFRRQLVAQYNMDIIVATRAQISVADACIGHRRFHHDTAAGVIEAAREIDHPQTTINMFAFFAMAALVLRDFDLVAQYTNRLQTEAARHGALMFQRVGDIYEAECEIFTANRADGLPKMARAIDELVSIQFVIFMSYHYSLQTAALNKFGQYETALTHANQTLDFIEKTQQRIALPETLVAKGQALLGLGRDPEQEVMPLLKEAVAVAREQGSHLFELRAAIALCQLRQRAAADPLGHAVLKEVLDRFPGDRDLSEVRLAVDLLKGIS